MPHPEQTYPTQQHDQIVDPEQMDESVNASHIQLLVNTMNAVHALRSEQTTHLEASNVANFNDRGYVAEAPRFIDQTHPKAAADRQQVHRFIERDTMIKDHNEMNPNGGVLRETSEHEALVALDGFIARFIDHEMSLPAEEQLPFLVKRARNIQEGLSFIGRPEFEAAVQTIGAVWKSYLDEDPNRQLCVLTAITGANLQGNLRKSDEYVRDAVLDTFSHAELEKYNGRLITQLYELRASPEDVRIVVLDDWTISGSQIQNEVCDLRADRRFQHYQDRLEVQLIACDEGRIDDGFKVTAGAEQVVVPVRAVYVAHGVPNTGADDIVSIISGQHSSVDFYFEDVLAQIVDRNKELRPEQTDDHVLPALAHIVREYRTKTSRYRTGNHGVTRIGRKQETDG